MHLAQNLVVMARRSATVTVSAIVKPAEAGRQVRLEVRQGRTWKTVGQALTGRSGGASIKYKASARPGASTMRFVTASMPSSLESTSAPFAVRVK